jgi:hypothetical protein
MAGQGEDNSLTFTFVKIGRMVANLIATFGPSRADLVT